MEISAALIDLDGTLTSVDLLDVVCDMVGKRDLSKKINQLFHDGHLSGSESLIQRLNLVQGVSLNAINDRLKQNTYLREGAFDLLEFLRKQRIKTILSSGEFTPVLEFYQRLLGADYVSGTTPIIRERHIYGVAQESTITKGFKMRGCKMILDSQGIQRNNVVAFGDSMADKSTFDYAALKIAVDPKGSIEQYADFVIRTGNLREAIPFLESKIRDRN